MSEIGLDLGGEYHVKVCAVIRAAENKLKSNPLEKQYRNALLFYQAPGNTGCSALSNVLLMYTWVLTTLAAANFLQQYMKPVKKSNGMHYKLHVQACAPGLYVTCKDAKHFRTSGPEYPVTHRPS